VLVHYANTGKETLSPFIDSSIDNYYYYYYLSSMAGSRPMNTQNTHKHKD